MTKFCFYSLFVKIKPLICYNRRKNLLKGLSVALYNYLKADLYLIKMMLDHVQLVKKTVGHKIDADYMVGLEHIAYHLREISDETKRTLPELDWACLAKLQDLIAYEVYHFKPGDTIETVSDELLLLEELLPQLQAHLTQEVESTKQKC